jgi:hypothetical protein
LLWIGLKNSDAVGLRVDVRTELLVGGVPIAQGELSNITTGSSGFNNALLRTINMSLSGPSSPLPPGPKLPSGRPCGGRARAAATTPERFGSGTTDRPWTAGRRGMLPAE